MEDFTAEPFLEASETELSKLSDERLSELLNDTRHEQEELLMYERYSVMTKTRAKELLAELDGIKKAGHVNSVEYDEMRQVLEDVSRIGEGMVVIDGEKHQPLWDYDPQIIDATLEKLQAVSEEYERKHSTALKAGKPFGRDRLLLSIRLMEFSIEQKRTLEMVKPSAQGDILAGIRVRNDWKAAIINEQKKRGLVADDYKEEIVNPVTEMEHDEQTDEKLICKSQLAECILMAKKNNRRVHLGSSEFFYSIASLKEVLDAYVAWMAVSDSVDKTVQREYLEELDKKISEARKNTKNYLDRKERQGITMENADPKAKERIELMTKANQSILKSIDDLANKTKQNLHMVNPEAMRNKYDVQIKNAKGSRRLAAQGALKAVNRLMKIADREQEQLSAKSESKARSAIASLVYNEMIWNAEVSVKPQTTENYLEQVRNLYNSEAFIKALPATLDGDTIRDFVENESAATRLYQQVAADLKS